MSAAPAKDPSGRDGPPLTPEVDARNAMWVTKIISQTNNAPNSATPKNHTKAEARHQQGVDRRATSADGAELRRHEAGARQREQRARDQIQVRVGARQG